MYLITEVTKHFENMLQEALGLNLSGIFIKQLTLVIIHAFLVFAQL